MDARTNGQFPLLDVSDNVTLNCSIKMSPWQTRADGYVDNCEPPSYPQIHSLCYWDWSRDYS